MAKDPIINFDIIHHESRGDPLAGSYKDHQSIKNTDLRQHPLTEKKAISGIVYNIKRKDMFFEKKIIKEHFLD